MEDKALWRRYSWFESMRGSHSTRFQLAHGRPSDETGCDLLPRSPSELPLAASELITDTLITLRKTGKTTARFS
jgi:hypothetical protein